MMHHRRAMLALSLMISFLLGACGSSNSGGGGTTDIKIMVGGISKQIYLPNKLTQQLGYFTQEGLNVTLIDEPSGASSEEQVLAGQVDAGSGSYNHTLELQAAGKNMECVVQLGIAPGEAEMVPANSTATSMADLKGKNLGVTELGSGTQTIQTIMLHNAGISADQVHFIPVGAGDTFIAGLTQGKINAGMTTEPTISRLIQSGQGKILVSLLTPDSTKAAFGGSYPFICLFMNNSYVNSHRSVTQHIVNAYVKTLKWMQTHTPEQIAAMMPQDYYAGNQALYVSALKNQFAIFSPDGKMPTDGPQSVLNDEYLTGAIKQGQNIDASKTFTNEFVNAANN